MKKVVGYLLLALGLIAIGLGCLGAWWLDSRIAQAQQAFETLSFERSQDELAEVDRYLDYGKWVPWIGADRVNELRASRVAADYWRGQYGRMLPAEGDPMAALTAGNPTLQLLTANAVFREGMKRAQNKEALLQVIDRSLTAYGTVLRNAPMSEDAAYNYEYLRRLRAQVMRSGRRQASTEEAVATSPHGVRGAPPMERDSPPFEILVPQNKKEENPDAGRSGTVRRRG